MNECPFCGGHLDCESNDIWFCDNCSQVWIRVTDQMDKMCKIVKKKNKEKP